MTKAIKRSAAFLSAVAMVMAMLLYFPGGMFSTYFGLKASAEGITLTEPQKDGNGVYQIGTAEELYWFAACVNGTDGVTQNTSANAVLTADITVNTGDVAGYNGTKATGWKDWTPVGNYDNQYTGTFDGKNHTISGLYFNNTSTDYVGLFGYVGESGSVLNVGVVDSYFNGEKYVGGVCGYNEGTITSCYNTGEVSVSGSYAYVGGVCGYNYSGTISNCYNTGTVSGTDDDAFVGGVCGWNNDGTIENCYNTGAVSGTGNNAYVGGVCGNNCAYIGTATIKNCYNTGTVSATGEYCVVGGVCGYNEGGTITKCYYLNTTAEKGVGSTESDTEEQAESKTSDEMHTAEFCTLITYHSQFTNGFCGLCGGYEPATLTTDKYDIDGDTTKDTVYEIGNAGQLYWFADKVNNENGTYGSANAVLTADITVNEGVLKPDGTLNSGSFTSWTPIGWYDNAASVEYSYTGTFDGNGKTVSGLYFNDTSTDSVGLFGFFNGTVKNVGVADSYFNGSSEVGGVCGSNFSTITNCYNTGSVSGNDIVGGVCGENNQGAIINCYCLVDKAYENGGKIEEQFNSGEVAYLLSQGCTVGGTTYKGDVWGQTINTDDYPVLGGKKVLANSDNTKFANDVMIYGQNAALDGTIDYNIYVAADDNYEWSAKIDGEPVDKPEKTDGIYKFTCKVAAKDMAKNIEFYINENVKATVSVKKYLDNLNTSGNTTLTELVTAMETYGTAADKFFSNGTVEAPAEEVTADDLSAYTFTNNDAPEGISYYGSSLILKSETTIRHYFQLEEGKNIENFKFYVNGVEVPKVEKQGYYYIDIENISADELGTAHTVKINETTVISNYSALSYAETVLSSETANDNLKNLVKTLYLYNLNAKTYSTTGGGN